MWRGFAIGTNRGLLGYDIYLWKYENNATDDGVVVLSLMLAAGSGPYFNERKTLMHEVGLWLRLDHLVQDAVRDVFSVNVYLFPSLTILFFVSHIS